MAEFMHLTPEMLAAARAIARSGVKANHELLGAPEMEIELRGARGYSLWCAVKFWRETMLGASEFVRAYANEIKRLRDEDARALEAAAEYADDAHDWAALREAF